MATAAQVSANRRNAGRSTGPRTTVGKAVVAQNAIKHGLLARQHVVLGEDPQQFELSRRQWLEELQPVGNAETTLAERIAGLTWRLQRAERLQNELFDCLLTKELNDSMSGFYDELTAEDEQRLRSNPETDPALAVGRMLKRDYAHERGLERLMMYERWIENSLYRSMKELRQVQRERKGDGGDGEGASRAAGPRGASVPARPLVCGDARPTKRTPCGVTTSGADSAKQSQFAAAEGWHNRPYETPSKADSTKQSQSGEVTSSKCEVSSEAGSAPEDSPSCETKPMEAGGAVGSLPVRASRSTGILPVTLNHGRDDHATETPHGVTTNGVDCAKQSQSGEVSSVKGQMSGGTNLVKQSQSPESATTTKGLPRSVRRAAWHCHNLPRS